MNAKQIILALVALVAASSAYAAQPTASDLVVGESGAKATVAALKP